MTRLSKKSFSGPSLAKPGLVGLCLLVKAQWRFNEESLLMSQAMSRQLSIIEDYSVEKRRTVVMNFEMFDMSCIWAFEVSYYEQ